MKNLIKPIVCFDIETTGLSITSDKIIEIFLYKYNLDGSTEEFYSRFNPGDTEISLGAYEKHGIKIEDLKNEPLIKEKIPQILEFMKGCDLCGYNLIYFDVPFLIDEFLRNGFIFNHRDVKIYDAYRIWSKFESRSLDNAVIRFLNKEMTGHHEAKSDVLHTFDVFKAQVDLYGDGDIEKINEVWFDDNIIKIDYDGFFVLNESMDVMFGKGKYKNNLVKDIIKSNIGYFEWIANASDIPKETKLIANKLIKKWN